MVAGAGEPGGDEHRAELVAVEADRVGLVVEAGSADMYGGRVFDEAFLFGVAVEAGDGAEPAGDVARDRPQPSRCRAKVSMWARRASKIASECDEQNELYWRRSSAYASRVRPE